MFERQRQHSSSFGRLEADQVWELQNQTLPSVSLPDVTTPDETSQTFPLCIYNTGAEESLETKLKILVSFPDQYHWSGNEATQAHPSWVSPSLLMHWHAECGITPLSVLSQTSLLQTRCLKLVFLSPKTLTCNHSYKTSPCQHGSSSCAQNPIWLFP